MRGQLLSTTTAIYFDGQPASIVSVTDTVVTCVVPEHPAGEYPVVVITQLGRAGPLVNAPAFMYILRVESVAPSAGSIRGGQSIEIVGTGFTSDPKFLQIIMDGRSCEVSSANLTHIACVTPSAVNVSSEDRITVPVSVKVEQSVESSLADIPMSSRKLADVIPCDAWEIRTEARDCETGQFDGRIARAIVERAYSSCSSDCLYSSYKGTVLGSDDGAPAPQVWFPLTMDRKEAIELRPVQGWLSKGTPAQPGIRAVSGILSQEPPAGEFHDFRDEETVVLGSSAYGFTGQGFTVAIDFYNADDLSSWSTTRRGILGTPVSQGNGLWIGFDSGFPAVSFGPSRRWCRTATSFRGVDWEVKDHEWRTLVVRYMITEHAISIFVDGEPVAHCEGMLPLSGRPQEVYLGRANIDTWKGDLRDARIYEGQELTDENIAALSATEQLLSAWQWQGWCWSRTANEQCNAAVLEQLGIMNRVAAQTSLNDAYVYDPELTPLVVSINRMNGTTAGGTTIKLVGEGFGDDPRVALDGVDCATKYEDIGSYRDQHLCVWGEKQREQGMDTAVDCK